MIETVNAKSRITTCSRCGTTMKYDVEDIQQKEISSEGSYFFNMRKINFIECAYCKNEVVVK